MANGLIRRYGQGHLHFVTFTCFRRLPLLRSIHAGNIFLQILSETRDCYGFLLVGYKTPDVEIVKAPLPKARQRIIARFKN